MLIYNVTTKVSHAVHTLWLTWMQKEHIPEIMATGCFEKAQLVRLLETDEEDGPTYAVQYYAADADAYNAYLDNFAPAMRDKVFKAWGNQVIAFRSLMQVVE